MSKLQDYLATNPPLRKAVICYLVKDNEVLLGVRTRVSNGLGYLTVAGIGGGIEEGENPDDALIREVLEEIEVHVTDYQEVGRSVNLSPHRPAWNLDITIYLVTGFDGDPQKTKDIDPYWYPKDELPLGNMWPDNRITAPLVLDGKRIVGRFLYGEDGQIAEQDLRCLAAERANMSKSRLFELLTMASLPSQAAQEKRARVDGYTETQTPKRTKKVNKAKRRGTSCPRNASTD